MSTSDNLPPLSVPSENTWIDALRASLIETIDSRVPPIELQDKLREQVKQHREYLESLLDRAIKVLYFIAAFIVAVAGVFGVKTYWDIDDRLKKGAEEQINKYIDRDFIKAESAKRIDEYNRAAVIAYLTIKATDPTNSKFSPTDIDVAIVKVVVNDVTSPYFQSALKIVTSFDVFRNQYKDIVGRTLLSILESQSKSSGAPITTETQIDIIGALEKIRYSPAVPFLISTLDNSNISTTVQIRAAEAIPSLSEKNQSAELAAKLMNKISDERERRRELYTAKLIAASKLSTDVVLTEAAILSKSRSAADATSFVQLLTQSFSERTYYSGEEEIENKVSSIVSEFFGQGKAYFSGNYDSPYARVRPQDSSLGIMVKDDNGHGGATGAGRVLLSWEHRLIAKALIQGLKNAGDRDRYIKELIVPIIEAGQQRLKFEQDTGLLGSVADPFRWQDGFFIKINEKSNIIVSGFDSSNHAFIGITKTEDGSIENKILPLSEVDFSKMEWRPQSYTNKKTSPFWR